MYNRSIYGTVHVTTCVVHRVVVKKNTTTEDTYNNTEEKHSTESSVNKISCCTNTVKWNYMHKQYAFRCPSLLDSVIMFCHMCSSAYMLCVCMCVHVCVCVCVCVYASVLFKNSKGLFTHMHQGVFCVSRPLWAKETEVTASGNSLVEKA